MDFTNTDNSINDLKRQKQALENAISVIRDKLLRAPEGSLRVSKYRDKNQFYIRNGAKDTNGRYIRQKDSFIAEQLAQKDYNAKLLEVMSSQLNVINDFLDEYDPYAPQRVYDSLTEARRKLVNPYFLTDTDYITEWQNAPYVKLGFGENDPEFYTARGERVRSKSEILIADTLLMNNIPYRYEYPLYSNGVLVAAPDFNCLNVRLRKEFYWEHLGMMGKEEYADRNVKKIDKYTLADDFDERCLIITMETEKRPLNTKVIKEKIRRYLL